MSRRGSPYGRTPRAHALIIGIDHAPVVFAVAPRTRNPGHPLGRSRYPRFPGWHGAFDPPAGQMDITLVTESIDHNVAMPLDRFAISPAVAAVLREE